MKFLLRLIHPFALKSSRQRKACSVNPDNDNKMARYNKVHDHVQLAIEAFGLVKKALDNGK